MHMSIAICLATLIASSVASADGYTFRDGRFPEGKSSVFRLTSEQKGLIALYRKCRDNRKSPFIFRLTDAQSAALGKEAGIAPERFAIFESFRGDEGADIEFNIINRFSETEFEVPHKPLLEEDEVRDWEINVIGWAPSPLANADPAQMKTGECPK